MTRPLDIHSPRRLMASAGWGLMGQVLPLVVGVAALPFIVRGLGTDAFGAFQLAWVVLGYVALMDLGLGRATTKFVAEFVARGESDLVRPAIKGSLAIQAVIGIVGAGILVALVPTLVEHLFNVPTDLRDEASAAFVALAFAVPVLLLTSSLTGVLHAFQRFDLASSVQAANSVATYALPVGVIALGGGLYGVVVAVVIARALALGGLGVLVHRQLRPLPDAASVDAPLMRRLLAFGGWVSVSSVVSPLMTYLDRVVIGATLTLAAVAYYAAPFDVVSRLTILAASVVPPLFPAFSALGGTGDRDRLARLFLRSSKLLALATLPFATLVVLLAQPILQAWLGADFAVNSTRATQILALAMLVNAMAQLPYAALQGTGRADLPAKFHLLELLVYPPVLWLAVRSFGIEGAAGAWLFRVGLDAVLLYAAALRRQGASALAWLRTLATALLPPLAGCLVVALTAIALTDRLAWQAAGAAAGLGVFAVLAWRYSLDQVDRSEVRQLAATVLSTRR